MVRHMLVLTVCVLGVLCRGAFAQPAGTTSPLTLPSNTMDERVRACVYCHGEAGKGTDRPYFPRLAGKPAGYLFHQLTAFRDGRRQYAPMNYLLAYLPDEYLQAMARYYADAQIPYATPQAANVSNEVLQRGQQLAQHGDPGRQIPACATCHGPYLSGREPGIPGLLGLRADYLSAQLGAWRYGTRTAIEPDCMQLIAARLTERDVAAVAAWLSSMPIPAETRPLARSGAALPLQCGSQKP